MRRFVLLAVMIIGCIIYSGTVFAMQFYQMEEIGRIGVSQRKGGIIIENSIYNSGEYFNKYDKNNTTSYDKGFAKFGKGDDALYIYYDAYQKEPSRMRVGTEDRDNTVIMDMHWDTLFRIKASNGKVFYCINFAYGPDSQWCIAGCHSNGKFVKYIDTEEISKRYFGITTTKTGMPFVIYNKLRLDGDTIVIEYASAHRNEGLKGEFRFKWDEAAQWFSIEQVVY